MLTAVRDFGTELHELLTGDDGGRVCKDIPEDACREQPRNFLVHVLSLASTKTGDGLVDPKLVLAWLLGAMGAPALVVGLLVPVRESLALLPQLATASRIRAIPVRKWAWAAGNLVQGLAVGGMAAAGIALEGGVGGWTILGLLALFALGRSVCSVSYKDVLGKTIAKQTRGTATGTAGTIASIAVFAFGLLLSFRLIPLTTTAIAATLLIAATFWLLAAALFALVQEQPGATAGGGDALVVARRQLSLLREDGQLVRFIAVRGLLIATALAPPYMLALAGRSDGGELGSLGPFVVASSLAAIASSYVWGRFADRSSRQVLMVAAAVGAVMSGAVGLLEFLAPGVTDVRFVMPALLFGLVIAYQGVRLGRSTHVVDMAEEETRAAYTALSNTIIGVLLLAGGLFGLVAELFGNAVVLLIFAGMCVVAGLVANGLEEVQSDEVR